MEVQETATTGMMIGGEGTMAGVTITTTEVEVHTGTTMNGIEEEDEEMMIETGKIFTTRIELFKKDVDPSKQELIIVKTPSTMEMRLMIDVAVVEGEAIPITETRNPTRMREEEVPGTGVEDHHQQSEIEFVPSEHMKVTCTKETTIQGLDIHQHPPANLVGSMTMLMLLLTVRLIGLKGEERILSLLADNFLRLSE